MNGEKEERRHERIRQKPQVVSLIVRQLSPSSKTYQTSSSSLAWTPKTSSICLSESVGRCFKNSPHTLPQTEKKGKKAAKRRIDSDDLWKVPSNLGICPTKLPFFKICLLGNLTSLCQKHALEVGMQGSKFFGGQCHKLLETKSLPSKKEMSSFNHLENIHNFSQLWLVLGVKLMEINSNLFSNHLFSGLVSGRVNPPSLSTLTPAW